MKKLVYSIALIYLGSSVSAQLSFSTSSNNIPANFAGYGLSAVAPSQVYAAGALYNGSWTPGLYKSADDGLNWAAVSHTGINSAQKIYNAICYTGTKMIMATQDNSSASTGMFSSTDGGITWTASNTGLPLNFVAQDLLSVSPSQIHAIGALYSAGWTPMMYKSTDGGVNWSAVPVTGINSAQIIYNAICYTGNKMIMATQDNLSANTGIFSSTDGGSTWTASSAGIPLNFTARDLLFVSASEIYAVGALYNSNWTPMIYKSTDGGVNWSAVPATGINSAQVMYNAVCLSGNKMILATQDNAASNTGVFSSTVTIPITTGIETNRNDHTFSYFPNPVTDRLTLQSGDAIESISIFNLTGEMVCRKVFYELKNEIELDLSAYTKGLYFIRINAANSKTCIKVIVE